MEKLHKITCPTCQQNVYAKIKNTIIGTPYINCTNALCKENIAFGLLDALIIKLTKNTI